MDKTKLFAMYLPQYHQIPENDRFWGEGFTDWVAVRKAQPQFEGHEQPRIPLDNRYYDLSNADTIAWQAELAHKYGIDGFGIYHYWFKGGHKVLEKPAEIIRDHPEFPIRYFLAWDNMSWIRSWSNVEGNAWAPSFDQKTGKQVLLEFEYGDQAAWEAHFQYLLPFFRDERYEKKDGKPIFILMRGTDGEEPLAMCRYWDERAWQEGFHGMYFICAKNLTKKEPPIFHPFTYEPIFSGWAEREKWERRMKKYLHIQPRAKGPVRFMCDYGTVWNTILKNAKKGWYSGAVVCYDDTPRRGKNANVLVNASPQLFERNLKQLLKIAQQNDREYVFLTAWNEWGEGAYLEPDTVNGYAYLEAVKRAVDACSE